MMIRTALLLGCALPLLACAQSTSTTSSGPQAGQLPRNSFPMSNARVVSQAGANTAMVEVTRAGGLPNNESAVRQAARDWCGGSAQATRVTNRASGVSSRQSYLVRCG